MNRKSFHLRWNNHLQNLQSLFENLFNEQSLVDVTISCSDGTLYGHKLVLSACSPYFEQVFKDNPCKHPIMILKGIRRQDMQVLLEYMYTGSVDVGEDDLEILLDIATELRIKGLVQRTDESFQSSCQSSKQDKANNSSTKDSRNNVSSTSPNSQPTDDLSWQAELVAKSPPLKHKENSLHNNQANNSVIEDFTNNSHMMENQEENQDFGHLYPEHDMKEGTISVKREYQENSEEETNGLSLLDSLDESSENMQVNYSYSDSKPPESDEVNFLCHVCNRTFQNKGSYQRHMLTHAGVKPHHCTFCNQSFLRLSHLQRHIRVHTGERPYVCGQCPKQFARSDKLRQHYIIQHNGPNCTSRGGKPRGRPRKNHDFYPPSTMVSSMNNGYPNHDFYPPSTVSSMNSGYPSIDLNPASTSATVSSLHSTYPAVSVSTVLSMNAV